MESSKYVTQQPIMVSCGVICKNDSRIRTSLVKKYKNYMLVLIKKCSTLVRFDFNTSVFQFLLEEECKISSYYVLLNAMK